MCNPLKIKLNISGKNSKCAEFSANTSPALLKCIQIKADNTPIEQAITVKIGGWTYDGIAHTPEIITEDAAYKAAITQLVSGHQLRNFSNYMSYKER